jgi:hypothetical protein
MGAASGNEGAHAAVQGLLVPFIHQQGHPVADRQKLVAGVSVLLLGGIFAQSAVQCPNTESGGARKEQLIHGESFQSSYSSGNSGCPYSGKKVIHAEDGSKAGA